MYRYGIVSDNYSPLYKFKPKNLYFPGHNVHITMTTGNIGTYYINDFNKGNKRAC